MRVLVNAWRTGCVVAFLAALAGASAGALAFEADRSDVRVLIDISGSMRDNDPDNLRRPALRMLAGLLQPGTRAGVWTFARWTNNLVPVAEVDAAWKKRTQALSDQIASPGQFTNIEEVLDQASRDWEGRPDTHVRHLVLLTDGMVDVSKDAAENQRSRVRIVEALLPRLQAAGVKVHTIALSERADHELMRRLAGETGGWYQQVVAADELQRVFLRMFERVGTPDAVPLQDNRFVVDSSIAEATVLAFSKPDSLPVVLRSPSGDEYTDSDLPAGVAWFRDLGYDLITIASPQKGEWTLQADLDPDNRVMIVTDLKLQSSAVPAHIAAGEQTRVEAHLTNRGEVVTRQAFLRLLEVRADAISANGSEPQPLNDRGESGDDKAGDGRYAMHYREPQPQGEVELLIAVDSPTFMREKRYRLMVHAPVEAAVAAGPEGPRLTVSTQTAVMQPGATVTAWQEDVNGGRTPLTLVEKESGLWTASLADAAVPSFVQMAGTTRLGNPIERTLGPLMPPGVEPPPVVEDRPVAAEQTPTEAPAAGVEDEPLAASESDAGQGWLVPAMVFGGFNLMLLIGGGVWLVLRRRGSAAADEPSLDALIDEQTMDPAAQEPGQLREDAA